MTTSAGATLIKREIKPSESGILVDKKRLVEPRRVKVSSKRQITIPVDIYERHGFTEYALLIETESGLEIQPLDPADSEELTLLLLRYLMQQGLEGEELLTRYAEIKPKFLDFHNALAQSEADIDAGDLVDFAHLQDNIRGKHGL